MIIIKIIIIILIVLIIIYSFSVVGEKFNLLNCKNVCDGKKMIALHNKNIENSCLCVPYGFVSAENIHKKAHNMEIL